MSDIVLKLRNAAQLINEVADELDKAPEEPKAKIEFTTVRAVLAQKAATGFKAEVKALLLLRRCFLFGFKAVNQCSKWI